MCDLVRSGYCWPACLSVRPSVRQSVCLLPHNSPASYTLWGEIMRPLLHIPSLSTLHTSLIFCSILNLPNLFSIPLSHISPNSPFISKGSWYLPSSSTCLPSILQTSCFSFTNSECSSVHITLTALHYRFVIFSNLHLHMIDTILKDTVKSITWYWSTNKRQWQVWQWWCMMKYDKSKDVNKWLDMLVMEVDWDWL